MAICIEVKNYLMNESCFMGNSVVNIRDITYKVTLSRMFIYS